MQLSIDVRSDNAEAAYKLASELITLPTAAKQIPKRVLCKVPAYEGCDIIPTFEGCDIIPTYATEQLRGNNNSVYA